MSVERKILLNPGPATTTDSVKLAQVVPDICPREKEFGDLMKSVGSDLVKIAKGEGEYAAVLFASSGTGAVESVISSVVSPDKKILIINNGAYGKRMVDIAKAYTIPFLELKYNWSCPVELTDVAEKIESDGNVGYLAFIHHETTTGQLNPMTDLCRIAKAHNCVTIVDAMSSFAGLPIDVKQEQVDFLISSANKCIGGMAGVSFAICRLSELEKVKDYPRRNVYFSLYDQHAYIVKENQMRFTPPVQTMYALRQAISEFFEEGAENRFSRFQKSWEVLYQGLSEIGFKFLISRENQSGILTAIYEPEDKKFNFDQLHDLLFKRGFTIYPGKLDDDKKTFRIANMGAIDYHDIENFLVTLKEVLRKMKIVGLNL